MTGLSPYAAVRRADRGVDMNLFGERNCNGNDERD